MFPRWLRPHGILIIVVIGFIIVSLNWTACPPSALNTVKLGLEGQYDDGSLETDGNNGLRNMTLPPDPITFERERLVEQIRSLVIGEMEVAKRGNSAEVKGFNADRAKEPIRVLLLAHWRSGSSFIGDVLASHPGAYYVFEPLLQLTSNHGDYLDHQIRGGPMSAQASFILKELFKCRFDSFDENYFRRLTFEYWFFNYNTRLLKCNYEKPLCSDVRFLSQSCTAFPVQIIKVVRYRLDREFALLEDPTLKNLRVVYIIRDPRAIMTSRIKLDWCIGNPECRKPRILCHDLAREYHVAKMLQDKYPERFTILRYETMAQKPFDTAKDIFKFLHLMYTSKTERFLQVHTSVHMNSDPFSTFRDSKSTLEGWLKEMSGRRLKYIEDSCTEALELWGYRRVTAED